MVELQYLILGGRKEERVLRQVAEEMKLFPLDIEALCAFHRTRHTAERDDSGIEEFVRSQEIFVKLYVDRNTSDPTEIAIINLFTNEAYRERMISTYWEIVEARPDIFTYHRRKHS